MARIKETTSARFKWNRSQLIESNTYVKVFTETLNKLLAPDDRQTLFIISRFFADGAAESGRRRLRMAQYFFERGEKYTADIPAEKIFLKGFLNNIYDRSKSFYYYRIGNPAEAIRLINNTLINNQVLEANGFAFLLFDRVSQYHNLAKIYFSLHQPQQAFEILSEIVCFLMVGRSDFLPHLNNNYLTIYTQDLINMRYSLLADILFETTSNLQKETDKEIFFQESKAFFLPILRLAPGLIILEDKEALLQNWLLLISLFYERKFHLFKKEAEAFLVHQPLSLRNASNQLLRGFINHC